MEIPQESLLLRVFVGETARWHHRPLYEAIVLKARKMHLAGATVLRANLGYGKSSRLHATKILRLSDDLPLVIEIVDSDEKINAFLPALEEMMHSGLVTLEKARVIFYRGGKAQPPPHDGPACAG
jgi:PII-like signaling protein